jgi:hypothetical protein
MEVFIRLDDPYRIVCYWDCTRTRANAKLPGGGGSQNANFGGGLHWIGLDWIDISLHKV